ncbi:MAG: hypothetical protein ACRBDL_05075 [Alphaproteobacteria bacterium]
MKSGFNSIVDVSNARQEFASASWQKMEVDINGVTALQSESTANTMGGNEFVAGGFEP